MIKKIAIVIGTRPDTIKMAPLIYAFSQHPKFQISVIASAQHREMLDQVLKAFGLSPDYDLNIMRENQSLYYSTSSVLRKFRPIFKKNKPDIVFVQGDTTTSFASALAAYYEKIPVVHIEAGLRTYNKYSPFPEEINRHLIDHLSDLLFAPTEKAKNNLLNEGLNKKKIYVTGNTGIDALNIFLKKLPPIPSYLSENSTILFMTLHRRENFGEPMLRICKAVHEIIEKIKNTHLVLPVHPNPQVKKTIYKILNNHPRISLLGPLDYPEVLTIMKHSYILLTDSGGIQEEGPSLKKPVVVLREITERPELIEAGGGILVGSDEKKIKTSLLKLLEDKNYYRRFRLKKNPFGDGKASLRIVKLTEEFFNI